MADRQAVKVGLVGLGTIGCGTVDILQRNRGILMERLGTSIEIVRAADIDLKSPRPVELPSQVLTSDAWEVVRDPEVQIVVELIGGIEPARSLILEAFDRGKHVVTANKALLSAHWSELVSKADEIGVTLGFEGSVAGGIPLIRAIKVGLVANRIQSVTGIINGTCNYILTRMHREGRPFTEILSEAQALGYAEADPALDVNGVDAAQKLAVLVNLCFNAPVSHEDILYKGITEIRPLDLEMAEEFGYRVKLLASAAESQNEVEAWVHPALVPQGHPLAMVDGVFNAVYIEDDNLGPSLYYGRGAGDLPTGSAVVADIVSCARDILSGAVARLPVGSRRSGLGGGHTVGLAEDTRSEFYVRMSAADRPGVLSTIAGILGKNDISIASVIQRGRESDQGGGVPIVMITHEASHARMLSAIGEIDDQEVVVGNSFVMRILRSE